MTAAVVAVVLLLLVGYTMRIRFTDPAQERIVGSIVRAATRFAVQGPADGPPQCIRLEVPQVAFKRWRSKTSGGEFDLGMANPQNYAWEAIDIDFGSAGPEMKTALAQALAQDQKRQLRSLRPGWIDPHLAVVPDDRAARRCPVHILSEPAIVGDWAFIEDDVVCGPQCAAGKTLALRFLNRRWIVVAVAPTWHVGFDRLLREPLPPPDSNDIVDV